jgi:RND family efflux transporter MFP subunit
MNPENESGIQKERTMSVDEHQFYTPDPANAPATPAYAPHGSEQVKHETPKASRGALATIVLVILIAAVIFGIFGVLHRRQAHAQLIQYTDITAAPPVSLAKPVLQQSAQEIVLPGNIQAFNQAPIYARTTGYVKAWYKDIGAHVKKDELLAVIETPELDQQLAVAKADLATAQANAAIAKTTAGRYQDLIGQNAVSQQDTDTAVNTLQARTTEVNSAVATVKRLEELQSFERVTAPFDGVITARNLDIGQLISATGSTTTAGAGTVTGSKEIYDIAAIRTLRVYVNVPQIYSPDAKNGVIATLTLPQYPGRKFQGKLVRTSDSVDPATRTLLAEIDVDNRTGDLLPGSYTEVHLHTSNPAPALVVPVSALILTPNGLNVGTVDGNSVAHIVRVLPGRDLGSAVEIINGLQPGQSVIANPPDSLTDGEKVRVVTPDNTSPAGPKS